jgi:hypothetical protein
MVEVINRNRYYSSALYLTDVLLSKDFCSFLKSDALSSDILTTNANVVYAVNSIFRGASVANVVQCVLDVGNKSISPEDVYIIEFNNEVINISDNSVVTDYKTVDYVTYPVHNNEYAVIREWLLGALKNDCGDSREC